MCHSGTASIVCVKGVVHPWRKHDSCSLFMTGAKIYAAAYVDASRVPMICPEYCVGWAVAKSIQSLDRLQSFNTSVPWHNTLISPGTLDRATHRPVTFPRVGRIVRDTEQGVAPDLPQSTVSAVRTALSNRQVQIHELQVSGRLWISFSHACERREWNWKKSSFILFHSEAFIEQQIPLESWLEGVVKSFTVQENKC